MIVKNEKDLLKLKEAGKTLASILKELKKIASTPGKSPIDVEEEALDLIEKFNCEPATLGYTPSGFSIPYPAATCISVNEVIVHGIPTKEKFNPGDLVSVDVVIKCGGVYVDAAFSVIVKGKQNPLAEKLIQAVEEAKNKAIEILKPGTRVGEIGEILDSTAKKYGFTMPKELGGHGVGEKIHQRPFIANYDKGAPDSNYILKEGEVITIEPMMSAGKSDLVLLSDGYTYKVKDNSLTAHTEDTIVILKDGPEILTRI